VPWWFAVVEARHQLQNPTSPEKILLLGDRLGLGPDFDRARRGGRSGRARAPARAPLRLSDHLRRAGGRVRRCGARSCGRGRWTRDLLGWAIFVGRND
jgi:hypothetical protein